MELSPRRRRQGGFTLVELLVVITIIGILAGLVTVAVFGARRTARNAAMHTEMTMIQQGFDEFRNKYGDYPPDFAGLASGDSTVRDATKVEILRWVKRCWRRYQPGSHPNNNSTSTDEWVQFCRDLFPTESDANAQTKVAQIGPAGALVFWLGGGYSMNGSIVSAMNGFDENPAIPFGTGSQRTTPFFKFDMDRVRLVSNGSFPQYFPDAGNNGSNTPYMYFRAKAGGGYADFLATKDWMYDKQQLTASYGASYGAAPLYDARGDRWYNPDTFQILCAGLDGRYRNTTDATDPPPDRNPHYTGTANITSEYLDNLTNFFTGTIEDEMERQD